VAFASHGQHQDAGAKVVHCAPHTSSRIVSKSIFQERRPGQLPRPLQVMAPARRSRSPASFATLNPRPAEPQRHVSLLEIEEQDVKHRPRGERLADRRGAALLPCQPRAERSRGLDDDRQRLIEPLVKELPMEYAVEMKPSDRAANGRDRRVVH